MPSPTHTHLNLLTVPDAAPGFELEQHQAIRFLNEPLALEQTGMTHHRIRPGVRSPFAHRHQQAEEVYVVLAGSGRIRLDDTVLDLVQHDAVRVPATAIRGFEAGPDGLEMLAVGARHEGDGEIVEGWWAD